MSDNELLELAAKAVGMHVKAHRVDADDNFTHLVVGQKFTQEKIDWNPLTDDGDALRLAASLNLCVCFTLAEANPTFGTAMVGYSPWENKVPIATERYSEPSEKLAATRRAIVKAAAEIGKAMP